jgi:hypothetical protein
MQPAVEAAEEMLRLAERQNDIALTRVCGR